MKVALNGIVLGYEDTGQGLPPLVLIHGFPLSRGAWRPQLDGFGPTHRVIAMDLRGFGESGAVPGPVPMTRFADDLKALLDHLGTGPVVLAGHSMGGYIALAFANAYPKMLRGLALVGTRSGPDTPEGAAGRRATAEKVKGQGTGVVIDAMAPKMVADQTLVPAVRELMQQASTDGVIGALLGMAERPDSTPLLLNLRLPVWVVTGADDILIPKTESERMAAAIPRSTLTVIPGAGHLASLERPAEFNTALRAWLDTLR